MDLVYRVNDPTPFDSDHAHGTKCAGIIGMERNNGICGVGIAPEATIGGKVTHHVDAYPSISGITLKHSFICRN